MYEQIIEVEDEMENSGRWDQQKTRTISKRHSGFNNPRQILSKNNW
jgi:hypothetical protein